MVLHERSHNPKRDNLLITAIALTHSFYYVFVDRKYLNTKLRLIVYLFPKTEANTS